LPEPSEEPGPDLSLPDESPEPTPEPTNDLGNSNEQPKATTKLSIQKLTGKLTQYLRDGNPQEIDNKLIKYVLNSIISAVDMSKLTENDVNSIVAKLQGEDVEDDVYADSGTEGDLDLGDLNETPENNSERTYNVLNNDLVQHILSERNDFDEYFITNPDGLANDICQAITYFTKSHQTPYNDQLNSLTTGFNSDPYNRLSPMADKFNRYLIDQFNNY
jgi:hypothetical protein